MDWANQNSGFLSLIIFIFTAIFAWFSGIIKNLMKKPKFKIDIIPTASFCSTFETGKKDDKVAHRTAIVLYLEIVNIGATPAQITRVEVGYHNYTLKYSFLWFWLGTIPAIKDFAHTIGENLRVFPFLFQKNYLGNITQKTYLRIGEQTTGIVYFEQEESWGKFQPRVYNHGVRIKVKCYDSFEKCYSKVFWIPVKTLEEARKYNPEFGNTLALHYANGLENWNY
jgi:hypothetical protein